MFVNNFEIWIQYITGPLYYQDTDAGKDWAEQERRKYLEKYNADEETDV